MPSTDCGVRVWSTLEHMRNKDMWVGSLGRVADPDLRGVRAAGEKWVVAQLLLPHSPALLTIIDEINVNGLDQIQRAIKLPKARRVSRLDVVFYPTGHLSIENDGPGIPLEPVAVPADFRRGDSPVLYIPEVCFSVPLAGSELERDPTSTKGGVNGAGAKGMAVNSTWVRVTTRSGLAGRKGLYEYVQVFRNRLLRNREDVDPPTIAVCPPGCRPLTRVEFLPAYSEMGYTFEETPSGVMLATAEFAELTAWLTWRMCITAAYASRYGVTVTLNGAPLPAASGVDIARLKLGRIPTHAPDAFVDEPEEDDGVIIRSFTLRAKKIDGAKPSQARTKAARLQAQASAAYPDHPWEVTLAVGPGVGRWYISSVSGVETLAGSQRSFLEGLVAGIVGEQIQKAMRDKTRKIRPADILRDVGIIVFCALPGANWDEQRKNKLSIGGKTPFQNFAPARMSPAMKEAVQVAVDTYLLSTGALKTKKLAFIAKYRKPVGPKRPGRRLILDEGDSADRTAQRIRSALDGGLQTFGTY